MTERKDPLRPTASQTWGWGASLWDYDWGFGEDFDTEPYRGTWLRGPLAGHLGRDRPRRSVQRRAGAAEQARAHRRRRPRHHHGDAAEQLSGTRPLEFRLQGHAWRAWPYRFLLELVPEGAPEAACSPASIVVADVVMGTPGLGLGVRSRPGSAGPVGREGPLAEAPFNMAVEVGRKHITWFRDAKPVFTLKGRRAQPGAPLVPRRAWWASRRR